MLPPLDHQQKQVLTEALDEAGRFGASHKETKALIEALIVESNIHNLNHGDADSLGALQQRPSQGWKHPRNVRLAVRDFLKAARPIRHQYATASGLAQGVQRSAFPDRYQNVAGQAEALYRTGQGHVSSGKGFGNVPSSFAISSNQSERDQIGKKVALARFLEQTDPGSMLLRLGVVSSNEKIPALQTSRPTFDRHVSISNPGSALQVDGSNFKNIFERAASINSRHLPYKWGGGHGPTPAKPGVPLDCSGAVSEVLGVTPRVAAQFKSFGSPGKGRSVTIWAAKDGHHVLMEINGHFWGTSATNPGGGAGWIPRSAISHSYLSGFVARHPRGM